MFEWKVTIPAMQGVVGSDLTLVVLVLIVQKTLFMF